MLFKKEWKKLIDIQKCLNNIVSRKEDVELTSEQRNIAKKVDVLEKIPLCYKKHLRKADYLQNNI